MADKINDLTAASAITESQQLEADTSGTTAEKLTIAQVRKYIINRIIVTDATTARTLALTDVGKYIRFTSGSAIALTVPANATIAFTAGDEIEIQQIGAGVITVTAAGGVTLKSLSSYITSAGAGAYLRLKYVGSDTWDLIGDLTSA